MTKRVPMKKSTTNITLNGKRLHVFPLKSNIRMSTLQIQQHERIIHYNQVEFVEHKDDSKYEN